MTRSLIHTEQAFFSSKCHPGSMDAPCISLVGFNVFNHFTQFIPDFLFHKLHRH